MFSPCVSALCLLLRFCEDLAAPKSRHHDTLFREPRAESASVLHYSNDHVVVCVSIARLLPLSLYQFETNSISCVLRFSRLLIVN